MRRVFIVGLVFMLNGCFFSSQDDSTPQVSKKNTSITRKVRQKGIFPDDCDWQEPDRVIDGDTIKLKNGEKVRFIGIDTPEVSGPYTEEQPFGREASEAMHAFLDNRHRVCLITDSVGDLYDKYHRRLAYVYTDSGKNLNAEMLKLGLAKVYRKFRFDRKQEFLEYEQIAHSHGKGLWE